MGDSHFIIGGHHAHLRTWVERLAVVGVQVELPPDDPRPATGGDFCIRLEHPDITGGKSALVRVGVRYHALTAEAPAEVVEFFEDRLSGLIEERWPDSVLVHQATLVGWAKDGRAGVLRYFDALKERDVEIEEEIARHWSDPSAKLEQQIEFWASGFCLCSLVAHDITARAIADATGGRLSQVDRNPTGSSYLNEDEVRAIIASAREAPARFELSRGDAEKWLGFEPFVSWEQVRAEEAAEEAEEELDEEARGLRAVTSGSIRPLPPHRRRRHAH